MRRLRRLRRRVPLFRLRVIPRRRENGYCSGVRVCSMRSLRGHLSQRRDNHRGCSRHRCGQMRRLRRMRGRVPLYSDRVILPDSLTQTFFFFILCFTTPIRHDNDNRNGTRLRSGGAGRFHSPAYVAGRGPGGAGHVAFQLSYRQGRNRRLLFRKSSAGIPPGFRIPGSDVEAVREQNRRRVSRGHQHGKAPRSGHRADRYRRSESHGGDVGRDVLF